MTLPLSSLPLPSYTVAPAPELTEYSNVLINAWIMHQFYGFTGPVIVPTWSVTVPAWHAPLCIPDDTPLHGGRLVPSNIVDGDDCSETPSCFAEHNTTSTLDSSSDATPLTGGELIH